MTTFVVTASEADAETRLHAALDTITTPELYQHVEVLADDVYEGRLAGSRGGQAAARYVVGQLEACRLTPAGHDGTFFQPCEKGYQNILALRGGSDPELADEVIVVSAHYDHVGYGTSQTSYGPVGYIHNGADDNASGVSTLLEVIEALDQADVSTRRSLLFAFWDGEEVGLVGSRHWVRKPTIPLEQVRLMINIDMVGWLRDGRLDVGGTRSGYGLRRLMSGALDEPLWLDFTWELKDNSDHWTFFQQGIPVAMLHTGLHDHYHRPTDDVERINRQGMHQVSTYLLTALVRAANADSLPTHRVAAGQETPEMRRSRQRPSGPLPPRIGIHWQPPGDDGSGEGITLTGVIPGSPADRAGLARGDRLVAINGGAIASTKAFQQTLLTADGPVRLTVERRPSPPQEMVIEPSGPPVRIGISWRHDEAEPNSVFLSHVVPGSPADVAGLSVHDRVYEVDGRQFANDDEFGEMLRALLDAGAPDCTLLVETRGNVRPLTIFLRPDRVAHVSR